MMQAFSPVLRAPSKLVQVGRAASTSQGPHKHHRVSPIWRQDTRDRTMAEAHAPARGVNYAPSMPSSTTLNFYENCILSQKTPPVFLAVLRFPDWHDFSCRVIVSCGSPLGRLGSIDPASLLPPEPCSRHVTHHPRHAKTPHRGY